MIFISGRGRSGTSLLLEQIRPYVDVCVGETLFIPQLYRRYMRSEFDRVTRQRFIDDLWKDSWIRYYLDDRSQLNCLLDVTATEYATMVEAVLATLGYHQAIPKEGQEQKAELKLEFVQKDPHFLSCLDTLQEIFPDAKFIFVVRDPRANVSSFKRSTFDFNSVPILCGRWCAHNQQILRFASRNPKAVKIVTYEAIVSSKATLQDIFEFLSLRNRKYSERSPDIDRPNEVLECFLGSKDPPDLRSLNAWKNALTNTEVRIINHLCAPFAKNFGYALIEQGEQLAPLNLIDILKFQIGYRSIFLEKILFLIPYGIAIRILEVYRYFTRPSRQRYVK